MAKAFGMEVSDLLLVGIIGVTAYFVWDTFIKPAKTVTNATAEGYGSLIDFFTQREKDLSQMWMSSTNALADAIRAGGGQLKQASQVVSGPTVIQTTPGYVYQSSGQSVQPTPFEQMAGFGPNTPNASFIGGGSASFGPPRTTTSNSPLQQFKNNPNALTFTNALINRV